MFVVKAEDGLFFPILQPVIARDPTVVFVDLSIPLSPAVKRPLGYAYPSEDPVCGNLRAVLPVVDVIDKGVSRLVGNPNSV
jgi:hypothetical protein